MGQWRELTQLQLSALIQFTASLGEIITALKPVSTVQRGSQTKAQILSFKYSPRVSGMLWRGRGALELSHYEWRSVYTMPLPGHVCLTCTLTQVSQRPTGSDSVGLPAPDSPALDTWATGSCKAFSSKHYWQVEGAK